MASVEIVHKRYASMRAGREVYHSDMIEILRKENPYIKSSHIHTPWIKSHPEFMPNAAKKQQQRFIALILSDICPRYKNVNVRRGGLVYINPYSMKTGIEI